ncbi:MAG: DnaD domain protein [Turicibacter sp.]|nr:DnaD domain protein [Turicibacter sp.]
MHREFKGIWIPREIWLNDELGWIDKLMLTEIDSLDNEQGCYATNDYFAKFFKLSKRRVIDIINNLENQGFITKKLIYKNGSKEIEKRVIKVVNKSSLGVVKESSLHQCRKVHSPSAEKFMRGSEEKCTDNNTVFNNTSNNTDYLSSSSLCISNNQGNIDKREMKKEDDNKNIVFYFYQQNFGMLNPYIIQQLDYWIQDLNPEVVKLALEKSLMNNVRNFNYTNKILNDWKSKNVKTVEDVRSLEIEYSTNKPGKGQHRETEKNDYGFKSTRF